MLAGGCAVPGWVPLVGKKSATPPPAATAESAPEEKVDAKPAAPASPTNRISLDDDSVTDRVVAVVNNDAITLMGKATGRVIVRVPMPLNVAKSAIDYVPGVYQLMGIPASAVDYFIHPTFYDTHHADHDLAALGIRCPKLADYMPHLVEFMRAHPDIESGAMV